MVLDQKIDQFLELKITFNGWKRLIEKLESSYVKKKKFQKKVKEQNFKTVLLDANKIRMSHLRMIWEKE